MEGANRRCRQHLFTHGSRSTLWAPLGQTTWLLHLLPPAPNPLHGSHFQSVFADTLNDPRLPLCFSDGRAVAVNDIQLAGTWNS